MKDLFTITVQSVDDLSPSLSRLIFLVENMEQLQGTDHPDEWVSLWFPDATGIFNPPSSGPFARHLSRGRSRPYTLRNIDRQAGTVTIDIVKHVGGIAAAWTSHARPGDGLLMGQPEGRFKIAPEIERVLIFSDITGVPAFARILEDLPGTTPIVANIVMPSADDYKAIPTLGGAHVCWNCTVSESESYLAVCAEKTTFRPGQDYVWIAAEARAVAHLKRLFKAKGAKAADLTAIGYWIRGQSRR
ncbi:SIP domain-containing protein [Xinfangfangia sp. D13-10-4-6]|uniref:siderophore-interacting protein n=1 Tax=Pseudogemmobacter hezensis TaxID=2737662 RepID=UPI001555FFD8|nr:SIP domain-containing protein [Pseudogemmobacter hezensis]NPD17748.1 SIP domain-containing protein [Pseudogemmobacter hezensis]